MQHCDFITARSSQDIYKETALVKKGRTQRERGGSKKGQDTNRHKWFKNKSTQPVWVQHWSHHGTGCRTHNFWCWHHPLSTVSAAWFMPLVWFFVCVFLFVLIWFYCFFWFGLVFSRSMTWKWHLLHRVTDFIQWEGRTSTVGIRKHFEATTGDLLLPLTSCGTLVNFHKLSQTQSSQKGVIISSSWEQGAE